MNIGQAIRFITEKLSPVSGEFALPQTEQIFESLLKCSRSELYLHSDIPLDSSTLRSLQSILERLLQNEPLPYVLGKTYFYSREFIVNARVLIPRPDTETLVDQVLANEKQNECFFADIGIGSGIISCILTEINPGWKAVGVDISIEALRVARVNNRKSTVYLLRADLLCAFRQSEEFDFLVSNPPYISEGEMNTLDPSVRDYEPVTALYGGGDGLDFYRRLASDSKNLIKSSGRIYCEIGYNQEFHVKEIFSSEGWTEIEITKDLAGRSRVIRAVKG